MYRVQAEQLQLGRRQGGAARGGGEVGVKGDEGGGQHLVEPLGVQGEVGVEGG